MLLRADAGAVYSRRQDFRPPGMGMHTSYGARDSLGRDTFVDGETGAAADLQAFVDRHGWYTAELDPTSPSLCSGRSAFVRQESCRSVEE